MKALSFQDCKRYKRKILNHVYDKRQTSDSRWQFLKLEDATDQIKTVLKKSYGWNWHETIYVFFKADTMNSQRPVNRKNVLSVVFEFPYTRFSESCLLAWSGDHTDPERRATSIRSWHGVFTDHFIFSQNFSLSHARDTLINSFSHLFHRARSSWPSLKFTIFHSFTTLLLLLTSA